MLLTPRAVRAAAVCPARSSSPARPATAVGVPRPGASNVSPPATRTTSCAVAPVTARVLSCSRGSTVAMTAVAVRSLVVEAGMPGRSALRSSRCAPVAASRIVTPRERPSPGSANAGASTLARAGPAGRGACVPATSSGVAGDASASGTATARRPCSPGRGRNGRGRRVSGPGRRRVEREDAGYAVLDVEPGVATGGEQEDEPDGQASAHQPPLRWTGTGTEHWRRA